MNPSEIKLQSWLRELSQLGYALSNVVITRSTEFACYADCDVEVMVAEKTRLIRGSVCVWSIGNFVGDLFIGGNRAESKEFNDEG